MNPIEIILTIIGVITIIASCILVDRSKDQNPKTTKRDVFPEDFTEEELSKIREKIDQYLSEASEESILRTEDEMSKLSNEKIIAVSEYSDQILEKINRNHEEVIFLYNMLNEKENDIKTILKETASSSSGKQEDVKPQTERTVNNQAGQDVKDYKQLNFTMDMDDIAALENPDSNRNDEILALYSKGMSVIEISKTLGLGQGEVKLVIDLFKGKK